MKGHEAISEEELIKGCRENNRQYQEVLYKRHFDMMYRISRNKIKDPEESMLVVNNAFLRAFKKMDLFQSTGSLGAWLRRILFNAIADYYRDSRRKNGKVIDIMEKVQAVFTTHSSAISELYYEDLIKMINILPASTKEVFTLFAIEGFSHKEIAEKLNIPEGSSKWQLHQARKILKAELIKTAHLEQKLKVKS